MIEKFIPENEKVISELKNYDGKYIFTNKKIYISGENNAYKKIIDIKEVQSITIQKITNKVALIVGIIFAVGIAILALAIEEPKVYFGSLAALLIGGLLTALIRIPVLTITTYNKEENITAKNLTEENQIEITQIIFKAKNGEI